ncbi:prenyltransferase/squalene oxidase repeat-containing protein [Methanococcoides orientis]|uniref:prenyltransferase/squalene oxidase repeat-containing protein n=1 Tax=Methanococcoides orientis TaxID=2822137 RepID=UPI001E2D4995|nr:prenyltransferase/squalene oxidase repeat-containing protein [Methanococcoides orientis]
MVKTLNNDVNVIYRMEDAIDRAFIWIYQQDPSSAKELSRLVTACELWDVENDYSSRLMQLRSGTNWNDSVRETARACSALASSDHGSPDIDLEGSSQWLTSRKESNGSWENDVYDTTYALMALADMGIHDPEGCRWLVENYGEKWEHVGTTSLIITALIEQDHLIEEDLFADFINERAEWILSERNEDGGWKFISTSNLVIQALSTAGYKEDLEASENWLLSRQNVNGSWGKGEGDVTATALSLITLRSLKNNRIY